MVSKFEEDMEEDDEEPKFNPEESVTGKLLRDLHAMHREMVQNIADSADNDPEESVVDDTPDVTGHFSKESLTLSHSLGYDCTRRNNLHVLDEKTLLYASGNLLHFLDVESGELKFLRTGGGVTALVVHPKEPLFAVAERGAPPNLTIYSWPSLEILTTIK